MYQSVMWPGRPLEHGSQTGVTLIEILITIVILGILSTLGIPSFVNMIKNNRLSSQTNALVGSIAYARSEAIKRNASVRISSQGVGGSWAEGWQVLAEPAGANTLLRLSDSLSGSNSLACMDNGGNDCTLLDFKGSGALFKSVNFILCDERKQGRKVAVTLLGQITTTEIAATDTGCGGGS